VIGRFAGFFSTPQSNSIMVAGFGTGESGFYFGYENTTFGILHSTGGVREIQTLTISAAATTGGTIVMRLAGIDYTVTIPTSTTTNRTAYDISAQTFPGWSTEQIGSTVIFLSSSVGDKTGDFTLTRGTALNVVGTFAETVAGVAATDTWVPQTDWNGDTLDGTGPSGYTLDKQKGNVFQIGVQYLGFGTVSFQIEVTTDDGNNADFVTVHTLGFPNTLTTPHTKNPSFPFTVAAYSSGSTTDVSVSVGSFSGFIEGIKKLTGPRMSYDNIRNNYVKADALYPLFTVRNDYVYNGRANQSVVNLVSIGAAHGDATPVILYVIRNATLVGPVSFAKWSTNSSTYVDVAATTCTIPANQNVVFSLPMGNGGDQILAFNDEVTIQPGETITLAAKSVTGTTVWVIANLNTREDQ
jgi:hypothetical protein